MKKIIFIITILFVMAGTISASDGYDRPTTPTDQPSYETDDQGNRIPPSQEEEYERAAQERRELRRIQRGAGEAPFDEPS